MGSRYGFHEDRFEFITYRQQMNFYPFEHFKETESLDCQASKSHLPDLGSY